MFSMWLGLTVYVHALPCCAVLCCLQSKGYVVGGHLANALLMVTHQMAFIQYRDFLPMDPPPVSAAGVQASLSFAASSIITVVCALHL